MTREEEGSAGGLDIRALARQGVVHFMGIAGAGMSALADLVLRTGGQVTGCDASPGATGETLRGRGAGVVAGHDPRHVADAVALVATSAVPNDHPEIQAARARGIPILKRAEALAGIVNRGTLIAVAGTHGKTSTTAMTTDVLEEAGLDPTAFVGGRVPGWEGGLRPGSGRVFVVEADEYDRSFLTLRPQVAVVTTVEADHLDIFGSVEAVAEAFRSFVQAVPRDRGMVALCVDDPGARALLPAVASRAVGYGLERDAELRATDVTLRGRGSRFRVRHGEEEAGEFELQVPGEHNVRNALAALAVAAHLGAPWDAARRALARFRPVGRRFDVLGEEAGVIVVDDYAHHPTEIRATLAAARAAFPGRRSVAVFQPHLYSRTRDFAAEFGAALADADAVWVTDVFAAREQPIGGVTGELVAAAAERAGGDVRYVPELEDLAPALGAFLQPGDLCLTMGAGNIDGVARAVLVRLRELVGEG